MDFECLRFEEVWKKTFFLFLWSLVAMCCRIALTWSGVAQ